MKSVFVRCAAILPLLILAVAACGDPTGPGLPKGVAITPSRSVFPIDRESGHWSVTITGVIRNGSDRTIFYQYCGDSILRRTQDGRWTTVWSPICPAIYIPPAPIAPGESHEFNIKVFQSSSVSIAFPLRPNDLYRVGVGLGVRVGPPGSEKFEPIRSSQSVSKAFRVSE